MLPKKFGELEILLLRPFWGNTMFLGGQMTGFLMYEYLTFLPIA